MCAKLFPRRDGALYQILEVSALLSVVEWRIIMAQTIIIDPLTRISGFLEINAEVEQNKIIDARAQGVLYRGFEKMLKGRPPLDAIFFTERICGICSVAHSYASALALEEALHIFVTRNDSYIREIIHGFEFIQNHLRHFYLMVFPSFVWIKNLPVADGVQYVDYRIPEDKNRRLEEHYAQAIEAARLAHEGQAVLGGKAPHNHGIFAGGVTADISAYKLTKVKTIVLRLLSFVSTAMLEDLQTIAQYYPEYYHMGASYPNFLSYGVFDNEEPEISYVKPGVLVNGIRYDFQPEAITSQIRYAWYKDNASQDEPDPAKPGAYTFIKAPRYNDLPMEVGPLARMLISGNYQGGHSCMDRIAARVMEAQRILRIMEQLVDRIELMPNNQREYLIPFASGGSGFIDTTRGALAHFIDIRDQVIDRYFIITPSNWNLSPKDDKGRPGTIEKALIGTVLQDVHNPVEIGRIVRSYDPCVSCATHLIGPDGSLSDIELNVL